MQNNSPPGRIFDRPEWYEIHVLGILDERIVAEFFGFEISRAVHREQPVTVITGCLADQTALAGMLALLNELGMVILLVKCLGREPEQGQKEA